MKINHNIRRFVACLTMAVATSASFFTEAQAGVEMKCVSLEKASYGDTTRTTIKYAPTFSYNGGVTISSAVSPELALTLGRAKINGEVILQDKELHRQLLNINNKTNIFVNGKMKPIYTIRDYVENVKLK